MARIRVLIVDDAVVVRRLVADALASDPDIEVVGTAANGRIALQKISQVNPDVVTMDIDMPELNGIEAVRALRPLHPTLPVIMFSTLTERGGVGTLDALAAGASDYVTKPTHAGGIGLAQQQVREELIPRIKTLAARRRVWGEPGGTGSAGVPLARRQVGAPVMGQVRPAIVAIGVSTGGPSALAILIPALSASLQVPVVIVQHMPALFTRLLADRLDASSGLTVREATAGMVIEPGTVTIAPGDHHMTLERRGLHVCVALNQSPPEHSCRPAVDPLFRSVVGVYGRRTLAVVLTGMGRDGLRGCSAIRDGGGQTLVQDEASSVVWGMPGLVVRSGLADKVLPISDMAEEIMQRVSAGVGRDETMVAAPGDVGRAGA